MLRFATLDAPAAGLRPGINRRTVSCVLAIILVLPGLRRARQALMPEFVCNFRYGLITYAQCGNLDPHEVVCHFGNLGAECIVGREHHADGGLHLHVFADFGRKFRSRRADIFDVGGRHPNIEASKGSPGRGYDYAIKDGDVVAGGLARPEGQNAGDDNSSGKWAQIVEAGSRDEFLDLCLRLAPRDAVTSWGSILKFADWKFAPVIEEYDTPAGVGFDTSGFDGFYDWLSQSGVGNRPVVDVHEGGLMRLCRFR
ncbi:Rep protein [egret CRESS-DNA virus]|nr:Rep protein [egret CRESS-DNA virus]